ncbi:hypothetical protein I7860_20235 [Pseudomonas tolaasii]|uniref:hypothetical protein n=1 Tax=Pseudomonas tolaasii TaxID=29442 RepID=UPI001C55A385|nr:hypothetical protein [Pseudomonas tolaasii]MBW1249010.1 hypothetical protein [Pseudomonas tolaasii]
MTKRAKSSFSVHQYSPSQNPWISIDLEGAEPGMTQDLLGFDLKPGTSFEQAEQIAKYLDDHLEVFTFTKTS